MRSQNRRPRCRRMYLTAHALLLGERIDLRRLKGVSGAPGVLVARMRHADRRQHLDEDGDRMEPVVHHCLLG